MAQGPRFRGYGLECEERIEWGGSTWQPGTEYLKTLHLRNVSTKSIHVRYALPGRKEFLMAFPDPITIPPGITKPLEVRFRPTKWEELEDQASFVVEGGAFTIPVCARLARLVLHVPPEVDFGMVPVNEPTHRTFYLRNGGQTDAAWEFSAGAPFLVAPRAGRLAPGASAALTASVVPKEACCLRGVAVCRVQGGEQVHRVALGAVAKYAHIALEGAGAAAPGRGVGAAAAAAAAAERAGGGLTVMEGGGRARLAWGDVPLGGPPLVMERTLTLRNDSAVAAVVDAEVEEEGEGGGEGALGGGGGEGAPRVATRFFKLSPPSVAGVPPGGAATFTLRLQPAAAGTFASSTFRFSTPGGNAIVVTASARVVGPAVALARRDKAGNLVHGAGLPGGGDLAAGRRVLSLLFTDAPAGARAQQALVVTNVSTSCEAAWGLDVCDSDVFAFSPPRGVLAPRASATITATFAPPLPGNWHRRVTLRVANGPPLHFDVLGTSYNEGSRPNPLRQRHVDAFRLRPPHLRALPPDGVLPLVRSGAAATPASRAAEVEWLLDGFPARSGDTTRGANAVYRELFAERETGFGGGGGGHGNARPFSLALAGGGGGGGGGGGALDFGAGARAGASEKRTVMFRNGSGGRVVVQWVVPRARTEAGARSGARDFAVVPEVAEVEGGGVAEFRVAFTPTADSFYYAAELEAWAWPKVNRSFRLVDEESFTPPACLPLLVLGHTFRDAEAFVPRVSTCFGGAALAQALALPAAALGDATHYTFRLSNSSEVPARFDFAFEGGGRGGVFSVLPAAGLIAVNSFVLVTLRFAPRAARPYAATLSLALNGAPAANTVRIALSGEGALPRCVLPNGGVLYVKPTCLGLASARTFVLRNAARVPARFEFRVPPHLTAQLSAQPVYGDIPAGGAVDVTVRFAPTASGAFRGAVPLHVYSPTGSDTNALTLAEAVAARGDVAALEFELHGGGDAGEAVVAAAGVGMPPGSPEGRAASTARARARGSGGASPPQGASRPDSRLSRGASRSLLHTRPAGIAPLLDLSALAGDSLLLDDAGGRGDVLPSPRVLDGSLAPLEPSLSLDSGGGAPPLVVPAVNGGAREPAGAPPLQRLLLTVVSEGTTGALRFARPHVDVGAAAVHGRLRAPLVLENTSDVELRWRLDAVVQVVNSAVDVDPAPEATLARPNALDLPPPPREEDAGEMGGTGRPPGPLDAGARRDEWEGARAAAAAALAAAAAAAAAGARGAPAAPPPRPRGSATRTLALTTSDPAVHYPAPPEAAEGWEVGEGEEPSGWAEDSVATGAGAAPLSVGARGGARVAPLLSFDPPMGVLPPHSKVRVELTFRPAFAARHRFRVYVDTLTLADGGSGGGGGGGGEADPRDAAAGFFPALPGASVSRAAAFAAAAEAEADVREPAGVDVESVGANANGLYCDVVAAGAYPSYTVEDARVGASREAFLALFPRHYVGAPQALLEAFSPTPWEAHAEARVGVMLTDATLALAAGGGAAARGTGEVALSAGAALGSTASAPPPLPAAEALHGALASAPVRDYWVRPEGLRAEAIAAGYGLPQEPGGGEAWKFALPGEPGGTGAGGRVLGGTATDAVVAGATALAATARGRAGYAPLAAALPPPHVPPHPLDCIVAQARPGLRAPPHVAPSPVTALPPARLWAAFSLRDLNGYLATRLTPAEKLFNSTAQATRDPANLAAFAFEFPPAPLGSPPCAVTLQLRNNSPLPLTLTFQVPTELTLSVEPWATEMDEPSADEFNDHELLDRNIFALYPRVLKLLPGQAGALRVHYAYATLMNGGKHEVVVIARAAHGKAVRLLLRGATLPPLAPALYCGLPNRAAELAPVPLGVKEPPLQFLPLRNPSSVAVRYAVLPHTLAALAAAHYGMPIVTVVNAEGVLAPGEEVPLRVVFAPVEAREYAVALHIVFAAAHERWDFAALAARAGGAAAEQPPASGDEGEEEKKEEGGGLGDRAAALAAAAAAAAARRAAAAGVGTASGDRGYEAETQGLLTLHVSGVGYQPGGIALGGRAAMPLHPSPPAARLGLPLPAPPVPSPLDGAAAGESLADASMAAATARWVSPSGGAAARGGGVGLHPRFSHPSSSLLNAAFNLGDVQLSGDVAASAQVLAGALSRLGTAGGFSAGARSAGGGSAAADALVAGVLASLGLEPMSAGVSCVGNPVDTALRLGVAAVAAGMDAAAVAHRLLLFGPAGAGLDSELGSVGAGFSDGGGGWGEEGAVCDAAAGSGEGGAGAGACSGAPPPVGVVAVAVGGGGGASAPVPGSHAAALAQLRHSQAVLQALSASATGAAGGGGGDAALVLAALAAEEAAAALAAARRAPSRRHAPFKGFHHRFGQAPLPFRGAALHEWSAALRARVYPLVGRLAGEHAVAHLYRPGAAPPLYFGAAPPLRRWAPVAHEDAPEGFAALSCEWLRVGDVPAGGATCRFLLLRNVRPPPPPAGAAEPFPLTGPLHWAWDAAHPLVASGVLRFSPAAGTLAPGAAAVVCVHVAAGSAPCVVEADVAVVVSVTPEEQAARAAAMVTRALVERVSKERDGRALLKAAAVPHVPVALKTTSSHVAKLEARARAAAVRAHVRAYLTEQGRAKSLYGAGGAAGGAAGGSSLLPVAPVAAAASRPPPSARVAPFAMPSSRGYPTPRALAPGGIAALVRSPTPGGAAEAVRALSGTGDCEAAPPAAGRGEGEDAVANERSSVVASVGADGARLAAAASRERRGRLAVLAGARGGGVAGEPSLSELSIALAPRAQANAAGSGEGEEDDSVRAMVHAVVHRGGEAVESISAFGALPPGEAGELTLHSARPGLFDDAATMRRERIVARGKERAGLPKAANREEVPGGMAARLPGGGGGGGGGGARRLVGDPTPAVPELALLPLPPHAPLWLHISLRVCSAGEFIGAYSPAHVAAFLLPPQAPTAAAAVAVARDPLAFPTPPPLPPRAPSPLPPADTLRAVLGALLGEVAADPRLAAAGAAWGGADVAAELRGAVAGGGAAPARGARHAAWAPERELVSGGLTFAALAAADGDEAEARAAAGGGGGGGGGGGLGGAPAAAPPASAGAAGALAAAAGALFDTALPRARAGVDVEVASLPPEVLGALQAPAFARAAAATLGALVGEVMGELLAIDGPLGGRAGTSYSRSSRGAGGSAAAASPLGAARPGSAFPPPSASFAGRGVTPKSAFGGLPRGAGTAALKARQAEAALVEQELRLDEEEVLRAGKEAPVYGDDE
jgi:hypothetical protein